MKTPTSLEGYRYKAYLELILDMVEEAYQDIHQQRHDLAEEKLVDILETFDRVDKVECEVACEEVVSAEVVPFPERHG